MHDLGDPDLGRPVDLVVTYSKHCCPHCRRCFSSDLSDLALPKCLYTRRVQRMAVRLVVEDGLPYQIASWHLWRDHRVFVPYATIQNWVEAVGGAEQKQLHKLMYGRRQLRTLRNIMDEVYRLFDRRCRTPTALKKLQRLRRRVRRFKQLAEALNKLKSPNLEKALEFLDDKLLGSTSNAVERANRRFRKAQKSIYCVRTKEHLEQRLALDMYREQRAKKRASSLKTLHEARSHGSTGHP